MTIEKVLGYKFKNKKLLEEALSHPSLDNGVSYERMEFLGDSVLDIVISELLYEKHPDEKEGELAKRRAALICGATLSNVALSIGIGKYIKMSAGEESGGGRENSANLENVFEAIIAAIYLDGGIEPARKFINGLFEKLAGDMKEAPKDPKTSLQEWAQARGFPIPSYKMLKQEGPAHEPLFTIEVSVEGYDSVKAEGTSKKQAEILAAAKMLEKVSE